MKDSLKLCLETKDIEALLVQMYASIGENHDKICISEQKEKKSKCPPQCTKHQMQKPTLNINIPNTTLR